MVTATTELKDAFSLERKAMTNLDSVLESRNTTLPTKVHLLKAMVFPVVCIDWELDHTEGDTSKSMADPCQLKKKKKRLNTKELMLSNRGAGGDPWESLGQQGDQISQS